MQVRLALLLRNLSLAHFSIACQWPAPGLSVRLGREAKRPATSELRERSGAPIDWSLRDGGDLCVVRNLFAARRNGSAKSVTIYDAIWVPERAIVRQRASDW